MHILVTPLLFQIHLSRENLLLRIVCLPLCFVLPGPSPALPLDLDLYDWERDISNSCRFGAHCELILFFFGLEVLRNYLGLQA